MDRVFTTGDLDTVIGNYRQQQIAAQEQLRSIDETRVHLIKTLDLLQGAVIALETLRDSPVANSESNEDTPLADTRDTSDEG